MQSFSPRKILRFPAWQHLQRHGKFCIPRLEIQISRLKIYIFSLKMHISKLKTDFCSSSVKFLKTWKSFYGYNITFYTQIQTKARTFMNYFVLLQGQTSIKVYAHRIRREKSCTKFHRLRKLQPVSDRNTLPFLSGERICALCAEV